MKQTITIARRFCGPPDSGNGGYVCGRLASFIDGPAIVRLKAPPPLEEELEVRSADDGVEMARGNVVFATAKPVQQVRLDIPPAPGFADAEVASRAYIGFHCHPYSTCFVCGPRRGAGDGLRIFPGPHDGKALVASPWIPDATLGDAAGRVQPVFQWASLDCPGAFTFRLPPRTSMLLGELAVELKGPVAVGERCVVIGWEFLHDGRKHHTGTALFGEAGDCRGGGKATWFEVPLR